MDKLTNVSVIIPAYNSAKYIIQTLDSLRNQVFENFEVLVVNDGSCDNTSELVVKYMDLYHLDIKLIEQQNSGVSVARNRGLANASGKYVVFIDSDDVVHPYYLEILYSAVENSNADTAFCSYSRNLTKILTNQIGMDDPEYVKLNNFGLLDNLLFYRYIAAFWCYIYKTDIIKKYGIKFTEGAKYGEDGEFAWKYLAHCMSGIFVSLPLYGYRDHLGSAVRAVSWNKTHSLEGIKRAGRYLKENNNEFFCVFDKFCYARTLWSILRGFAHAGNKQFYMRACVDYNARSEFRRLLLFPDMRLRLSIIIYLINPLLLYYLIFIFKL